MAIFTYITGFCNPQQNRARSKSFRQSTISAIVKNPAQLHLRDNYFCKSSFWIRSLKTSGMIQFGSLPMIICKNPAEKLAS